MSKWSDTLSDRLNHRAEDDRLSNQKSSRDAIILDGGLVELWSQVTALTEAACKDVNQNRAIKIELVYLLQGNQFVVGRPDSPDKIKTSVDKERRAIRIQLQTKYSKPFDRTIVVKLDRADGYYFASKDGPTADDDIVSTTVHESLDALMGL